jgi:sugar phosphate isomerase/epimerase
MTSPRIAVSNIAWPAGADEVAADLLRAHGVAGVEVAPTRLWPRPAEATESDAAACRSAWERRGLPIVAMQALLFGRPELTLFETPTMREETIAYLDRIIQLAGWLGCGPLVFGSPKNRLRRGRPTEEVWPEALDVFRRLGEQAERHGVVFCIEANPPEYGCDFVTTVTEAAAVVRAVGHPGVGLHLDGGGMTLTDEGPASAGDVRLRHFHVSEPHLVPVGSVNSAAAHARYRRELAAGGYAGWCSIEMRAVEEDWRGGLEASLLATRAAYVTE